MYRAIYKWYKLIRYMHVLIIITGLLYLPVAYILLAVHSQKGYKDDIPIPEAIPINVYSNETAPGNLSIASQTLSNRQHWWAGVVSKNFYPAAVYVSFQHETPDQDPADNEFIYVLISVFDNNGSYDQIGFAAQNKEWKIIYSWTTYNAREGRVEYHHEITDISLKDGWVYLFEMYTNGNGRVTFQVEGHAVDGSWRWETVFRKTVTTGGSYFIIAPQYYNPWSHETYRDFTDYEEGIVGWAYPHVNYDLMYTTVIFYNGQMIYFNDW
ncbi:MAG: hypothetical protein J7L07_07735 [Candidatus Odinarchaeota archaeon]|nr:hypothetical protein [Candidatus Odinarchaeota archaeon]